MKLYHRTGIAAAEIICRTRRWESKMNTGEAYFSTVPDGQADSFGPAVLEIDIPDDWAEIDDAFPSGEQHYRVHISRLAGVVVTLHSYEPTLAEWLANPDH